LLVDVLEADLSSQNLTFSVRVRGVLALEAGHVFEEGADFHFAVEAALFGEVADAVFAVDGGGLAQDGEFSASRGR
jgi:hypothetical protein